MSHQIRHFDKWGFNLFVTLLKLGYGFKFRSRSTSNHQDFDPWVLDPLEFGPLGFWTPCVLDPLSFAPP